MLPTMYVITHHRFNHEGENLRPLDERFLVSDKNYIFYLIDKERPSVLKKQKVLFEYELDQKLHEAGGRIFAEWSFLLAEAKYGFCNYPFFMISSRFYEKNRWLYKNLNEEWEKLFSFFEHYRWGYLPSYDRSFSWIDLKNYHFFPLTQEALKLTGELFGIQLLQDYSMMSDFFCNYIGFRSREDLLNYVNYYRPFIEYFYDEDYNPRLNLATYVKKAGGFRNEKPFTFYLEFLSHLYFYHLKEKFFALHYNGYYEIDERHTKSRVLERFNIPAKMQVFRLLLTTYRGIKKSCKI